jgi:hypothetical protein
LPGIKRVSKSLWRPFKIEFKEIEQNLGAAKDEVMEELQLASEQVAHSFRQSLTAEIEESRAIRLKQIAEMQENEHFRAQQTLALQHSKARHIHKILKEQGNTLHSGERE